MWDRVSRAQRVACCICSCERVWEDWTGRAGGVLPVISGSVEGSMHGK